MDYKPIRNKIRKYTYDSFTTEVLGILREQDANRLRPQPFWHPLLLLKWGLEFSGSAHPGKVASRKDVISLLKALEPLEMAHKTFNPKTSGRLSKTFSILAPQQFLYQNVMWFDTLPRQLVLFSKLIKRHDINASFLNSTGLTIADVLHGFHILWLLVYENSLPEYTYYGYFSKENWTVFNDILGDKKTAAFFGLLYVDRDNFKSVLGSDTRLIRDYNLQVFETSFFARRPLFVFQNKCSVPHRGILPYTFHHFIYDFLKHRDPKFSEELGARMEKYIELGLKENEIAYQTETELKKLLGKGSKVTDFLVEDEILIEAKAIEVKPYTSVNPVDALLSSELRENVVKAYALQMLGVANRMRKHPQYFGIIITYKELHLGDTNDVWEQFLRAETERLVSNQDIIHLLPRENLFLMSLATWDQMMQIVKTKRKTIKQVLLEAQINAAQNKFGFYMHLDNYKIRIKDLSYLQLGGLLSL